MQFPAINQQAALIKLLQRDRFAQACLMSWKYKPFYLWLIVSLPLEVFWDDCFFYLIFVSS